MKIWREEALSDFEFWSGATYTTSKMTNEEFDQVEVVLEECYPDGLSETDINDLFWFDFDVVAEWLGYEDEEDFIAKKEKEEEE